MFSEVVKLVPQVDKAALNSMFQNLNQRFTSVAKKFGDGMKNAFKFGGIIGIASAIIAKLLNPLERAEELVNKLLDKGSDTVTAAEDLGTTPGKLLQFQGVARAHGLDAADTNQLLTKFQAELAKEQDQAAAPGRLRDQLKVTNDPVQRKALEAQIKQADDNAREGGVLREFLNEKDTVEAFIKFILSLQAVPDKARRISIQTEVLGERSRGKTRELFAATDIGAIQKDLPKVEALDKAAKNTNQAAGLRDRLTAVREAETYARQGLKVNDKQVIDINRAKTIEDRNDDRQLKNFDATKNASIAIQELEEKFNNFASEVINKIVPELLSTVKNIEKFATDFLPSFNDVSKTLSSSFDGVVKGLADFSVSVGNTFSSFKDTIDNGFRSFDRGVKAVFDVWDEFKSGPIYRTITGGKKK